MELIFTQVRPASGAKGLKGNSTMNVESGTKLWRVPRAIDGHLVLDATDVVAVFEVVSTLNPITADSTTRFQAQTNFQAALDSLKVGEQVQLILDCTKYEPAVDIEKFQSKISEDATPGFRSYYPNLLDNYLRDYCRKTMVPVFRYYILFTYKQPKGYGSTEKSPELRTTQNEVRRRADEFSRLIGRGGLTCTQLSREAIVELLDSTVNPTRLTKLPADALEQARGASGLEASGDELLFRSPIVNSVPMADRKYSYLQVGGKLVKTVGFLRAPQKDNFMTAVIPQLMIGQHEFRLSFFYEGISQERALEIIQRKRRAATGAVTFSGGKETVSYTHLRA